MFCLKCGQEIDDNATKCPYCNAATENSTVDLGVVEAKSTSSGLGVAGVTMGALGIVLALLIALLGYIFGGAGLALSLVARSKDGFSKQAATGIVLSIIAFAVAIVNSILGMMLYGGF